MPRYVHPFACLNQSVFGFLGLVGFLCRVGFLCLIGLNLFRFCVPSYGVSSLSSLIVGPYSSPQSCLHLTSNDQPFPQPPTTPSPSSPVPHLPSIYRPIDRTIPSLFILSPHSPLFIPLVPFHPPPKSRSRSRSPIRIKNNTN